MIATKKLRDPLEDYLNSLIPGFGQQEQQQDEGKAPPQQQLKVPQYGALPRQANGEINPGWAAKAWEEFQANTTKKPEEPQSKASSMLTQEQYEAMMQSKSIADTLKALAPVRKTEDENLKKRRAKGRALGNALGSFGGFFAAAGGAPVTLTGGDPKVEQNLKEAEALKLDYEKDKRAHDLLMLQEAVSKGKSYRDYVIEQQKYDRQRQDKEDDWTKQTDYYREKDIEAHKNAIDLIQERAKYDNSINSPENYKQKYDAMLNYKREDMKLQERRDKSKIEAQTSAAIAKTYAADTQKAMFMKIVDTNRNVATVMEKDEALALSQIILNDPTLATDAEIMRLKRAGTMKDDVLRGFIMKYYEKSVQAKEFVNKIPYKYGQVPTQSNTQNPNDPLGITTQSDPLGILN